MVKKSLKGIARYAALLILLVSVFTISLYVVGRGTARFQSDIDRNVKLSMNQIEKEGLYPQNLDSKDYSMRFDNYTVITMLQECVTMNTSQNPRSIFTNPYLRKEYEETISSNVAFSDMVQSTRELTRTHETNTFYTYYWMGYRTVYRLLLCLMPYQDIRSAVAFVFALLFCCSVLAIKRLTQSNTVPICFAVAVALMNIPVISSDIQFATVFLLMMLGVICLCVLLKKSGSNITPTMTRRVCDLFFILGALTQFFDFYTVPVITLCFPLTVLLAAIRNEPAKKRFSTAALTVLAWLSAYVLVWAARLALVELFTEDAAFTAAFSKFTSWTGIVDDGVHSAFTPAKTASLVFQQLFTPQNIFCLSLMAAFGVFAMVRALVRKTVRTPRPLLLLVAVIPVIWMLAASRATGNHFWFQYRLISGTVFAIMVFVSDIICPRADSSLLQSEKTE